MGRDKVSKNCSKSSRVEQISNARPISRPSLGESFSSGPFRLKAAVLIMAKPVSLCPPQAVPGSRLSALTMARYLYFSPCTNKDRLSTFGVSRFLKSKGRPSLVTLPDTITEVHARLCPKKTNDRINSNKKLFHPIFSALDCSKLGSSVSTLFVLQHFFIFFILRDIS